MTYENCWLKTNCYYESIYKCSPTCPCFNELNWLMENSNIPFRFRKPIKLKPHPEDLEAFRMLNTIKRDIKSFVDNGEFLYLWGNHTGSGKTTWAIKLLQSYMVNIAVGNCFKPTCWFEYIPTLLLGLKDFSNNEDRTKLMDKMTTAKLLVLDDVGSIKQTNTDDHHIAHIINYRYTNGMATIFTSNLSPNSLTENIDLRLSDRILCGYIAEIKGVGSRGKEKPNVYSVNPNTK